MEEALEIYRKSKVIMQKGGFNLRKWCSNNAQVLQEINKLEMPEQNIKLEAGADPAKNLTYALRSDVSSFGRGLGVACS